MLKGKVLSPFLQAVNWREFPFSRHFLGHIMKKIISTIILAIIGYIISYALSLGEQHQSKDCHPYKQENSLIKIDLSDDDDDKDLYNELITKSKQLNKDSAGQDAKR